MNPVQHVSIVGAGEMGHGFAAHFANHGKTVTLVDHRKSNLDRAKEGIEQIETFLRREGMKKSDDRLLDSIDCTLDVQSAVARTDLVLETVSEDLETKQGVFREVGDVTSRDAILATNTSGIPITKIAEAVPDEASRIAGCHWWYPPYLLPTVEVIRGEATSDETIDTVIGFVESVDRIPIRVERDVPGFVWNRIQMAIFREALYLAETGVASLEDINRAVRDGYALRTAAIGPIETIDIAGLDLVRTVASSIYPDLCNDETPSELLTKHLEDGRGGIDDGAGLFTYESDPEAIRSERDMRVAAIRGALSGREDAGLTD